MDIKEQARLLAGTADRFSVSLFAEANEETTEGCTVYELALGLREAAQSFIDWYLNDDTDIGPIDGSTLTRNGNPV